MFPHDISRHTLSRRSCYIGFKGKLRSGHGSCDPVRPNHMNPAGVWCLFPHKTLPFTAPVVQREERLATLASIDHSYCCATVLWANLTRLEPWEWGGRTSWRKTFCNILIYSFPLRITSHYLSLQPAPVALRLCNWFHGVVLYSAGLVHATALWQGRQYVMARGLRGNNTAALTFKDVNTG